MKAFLEHTLQELVNHPEQVVVAEIFGRQTVILEIRCHPEDMGRIIGKNGKTISALRVLLTSLAAKQKRKAVLEVAE